MKKRYKASSILVLIGLLTINAKAQNSLTGQEKKDGWKLLFDGKTSSGWSCVQALRI